MVVPIESPEDDARFVFDASFVSVAAGMIVACDDEVVIGVTKEMSPALMDLWLKLLEPYSAEQVEAGAVKVIAEYEYKTLPPFAVLKRCMVQASGAIPEEKRLALAAQAEWTALLDAIQRKGRYNKPKFCAATEFVIRGMGGWDAVCNWQNDKLEWRRKEFLEAWENAYGHEETLSLGASGVLSIGSGGNGKQTALDESEPMPESVQDIIGRVLPVQGAQGYAKAYAENW